VKRVGDFLSPLEPLSHSLSISPDASPEEALALMRAREINRLTVTENGTPVGVVRRGDLARGWALVPLEQRLRDSDDDWERSRARWEMGPPEWESLTWGREATGDAFIEAARRYAGFGPDKRILEVGPGYGRLLKAFLAREIPFAHYHGLDISKGTCAYLREQFPREDITFQHGEVESASFETGFDVVLSSATFKHLFPSIEPALMHLRSSANPGCILCIDFLEGTWTGYEPDNVTFVHMYTRPQLLEVLDRVGLEHVAFDEVEHMPGITRLLMVARKPV